MTKQRFTIRVRRGLYLVLGVFTKYNEEYLGVRGGVSVLPAKDRDDLNAAIAWIKQESVHGCSLGRLEAAIETWTRYESRRVEMARHKAAVEQDDARQTTFIEE